MKYSFEYYFPTMILVSSIPDEREFNRVLLDVIREDRIREKTGIERSNFRSLGGWHSQNDLHERPEFEGIRQKVNAAADHISISLGYDQKRRLDVASMWAIINPPGSSNKSHIHPGCHWSGVYYVQAPEGSGHIEFTDPRTEHIMNEPSYMPNTDRLMECWTKVKFKPTPGKLLLFPSFLYHSVEPNLCDMNGSEGERVIISFNLLQRD